MTTDSSPWESFEGAFLAFLACAGYEGSNRNPAGDWVDVAEEARKRGWWRWTPRRRQ